MPEPVIAVRDLVKVFHVRKPGRLVTEPFTAVDRVSFDVAAGGSLAIVGESGSGKSTTARMIVGLELATSGSVRVTGSEWHPDRATRGRERRRRGAQVQMVFQDPYQSLDRRQSVQDCIDECLRLHTRLDRTSRTKRVHELLDRVRLERGLSASLPRHLSGGQRQRVAIARALAAEPQVLILDEAVSALDVSVQAEVLALLAQIREETSVAFIFISHDLPVVQQVCDDVLVMRAGEVVESGGVTDVLTIPQHDYTRRLIDSVPKPGWRPRRRLPTTDPRPSLSMKGTR